MSAMLQSDAQGDASSGAQPMADRAQIPPPTSYHIVLWILATAGLFAVRAAKDYATGPHVPEMGPWTTYSFLFLSSIVSGAALVGAGVLFRLSRTGAIDRLSPGHWITINYAIVCLLGILLSVVTWWMGFAVRFATSSAVSAVGASLYFVAAIRLRDSLLWRGSFVAFAAGDALAGIGSAVLCYLACLRATELGVWVFARLMPPPIAVVEVTAIILFMFAVVADLRRVRNRDWLHWLGIAVAVGGWLVSVAQAVAMVCAARR